MRRRRQIEKDVLITTESIKGKLFKILVNGEGEFYTMDEHGKKRQSKTLRELRNKLRADIAGTSTLNIPFTRECNDFFKGSGLQNGFIMGVHDSNRNLLVRYEGQTKNEQMSSYTARDLMVRFTDKDVKEYKRLAAAQSAATKAFDQFVKSKKLKDPVISKLQR